MKNIFSVLIIILSILLIISVLSLAEIKILSKEIISLQTLFEKSSGPKEETQIPNPIEITNPSIANTAISTESLQTQMNEVIEEIYSIKDLYSQNESLYDGEIMRVLDEIVTKQELLESQLNSLKDYEQKVDSILNILKEPNNPAEFDYDAPTNEEEFTYIHIRFLNALNRNPKDTELWKKYISFVLTYGNYSDLQIAEENLSSAILFVPEEDINLLLSLENTIEEAMTSLERKEPNVVNVFYEKCTKLEKLFLSEECIDYTEISNEYNILVNQYSSLEDIDDNTFNIFTRLTNYFNVLDSFESIKQTANYWIYTEKSAYDTCQILSSLQTSLVEAKVAYSQFVISSASILHSKYEAESAIDKLNTTAINLVLQEADKAKPNTKYMPNEQAKVEYTKYESTLERLSSYLPNDIAFQDQINQKILDCYTAIAEISESQSRSYQIWTYNTTINAKNKTSDRKDKDSFAEFFLINSALITVPEIHSLYVDALSKVKEHIGDEKYKEYVKQAASQGLMSYEDF